MTAILLPFAAPSAPTSQLPPRRLAAQTAEEAVLVAQVLLACAPPRADRLDCKAAVIQSEHAPWRPAVVVPSRGLEVIASTDTMRRIAVSLDDAGRNRAALDLLAACDEAEALAAHMLRSVN